MAVNSQALALAKLARQAVEASALDDICQGLIAGELTKDSTAVSAARIAQGRPFVEKLVCDLLSSWTKDLATWSGPALATGFAAAAYGVQLERDAATKTQVVWSGPDVEGSFLRATREVIREIVDGATEELLVLGYWIAGKRHEDGIIEEIVNSLAAAVERGVWVALALDESEKQYGRDNRDVLFDLWPSTVRRPAVLTWHSETNKGDPKLHAKVLVADRRDALVTSANLTMHAMDINMELGVRVIGAAADKVASHIRLLIRQGILQPFGEG